jgi:predicted nucleic acid-binding protein
VPQPLRLLDTSVIVRYLSNDLPDRAEQARRLIESDVPLGITAVALLEVAYVLRGAPYRYARSVVVDALVLLLQRENVHGVGMDAIHAVTTLQLCRASTAVSVGDALIAATGLSAGVSEVYSFDARIGRSGLRVMPFPDAAPGNGQST